MSFLLLFKDELKGFYKSKIMAVLWVGMPLMAILMHFIQPDTEELGVSILTGLLMASIGGLLAAVMLSTTMVNELNAKVYDLFLVRPVKRAHLILAKFFAVYLCLVIAAFLALGMGLAIDSLFIELPPETILRATLESLAMSMAAMAISCAAGILIGMLVKSVGLAAILSIYLGQQLSLIAILPGIFLENFDPLLFSVLVGLGMTFIIITVEVIVFNRKQF